jgi:UDP-N-acetylglucosamine diphosphorylase/glucosamine-1-phosphate N-acetyltransferase
MKAVILAAGEGTRMRPLTYTRPKVMLPVANRPMLEHLVRELCAVGIREFIMVVGYHDEQVRDYFQYGEKWGVRIEYVNQRSQLGTADALRQLQQLAGARFLVVNGDAILRRDDLARFLKSRGNAMGVCEVSNPRGLGVVQTDGKKLVRIYEKTDNPPSRLANIGLYLFNREIFEAIADTPQSLRGEYEITDSIQILVERGWPVLCHAISYWLDLSRPWDLLSANEQLLKDLPEENRGEIEPGAYIKGPVQIGKNSLVRSGSYINGPVIIGANCDIGPHCFIRPATTIGDHCHIGAGVEIKNSIVMRGRKIPHLNYVGDSVIGEDCNLGAGTIIANLKLDKKNIMIEGVDTGRRKLGAIIGDHVEVGINASINVGCVIGNNTLIGPGAVASGVIAPRSKRF